MLKQVAAGSGVGLVMGGMIGTAVAGGLGGVAGGVLGMAVGGGVMTAVGLGGAFSDRYPQRARHVEFDCPHSRRHVKAVLLENADTERIFEIESCSVFTPPTRIRCERHCVEDLNAGLPAAESGGI